LRLKRQGCIHSDFQQGAIVAEVVAYKGFVRYEGAKRAKAAGGE
jgi:ribosome-binding ATPase YchF (GTP1/OBG family)